MMISAEERHVANMHGGDIWTGILAQFNNSESEKEEEKEEAKEETKEKGQGRRTLGQV
jgi:hypothetical protein